VQELMMIVTLVGNMTVTSYRSVPEQTDDSPFITSIGQRTHPHGVAVSQDLLKSGALKYGDFIMVEGYGLKVVNDTMNPRHKNHVDLWVETYQQEKAVGVKKLKIYRVRGAVK
jgi:3D (Asp-Asp-Asp) domain-containing protein